MWTWQLLATFLTGTEKTWIETLLNSAHFLKWMSGFTNYHHVCWGAKTKHSTEADIKLTGDAGEMLTLEKVVGYMYGNCWVSATDWSPEQALSQPWEHRWRRFSCVTQGVEPGCTSPRPHLRADCHWGRVSCWRSLLCGVFPANLDLWI